MAADQITVLLKLIHSGQDKIAQDHVAAHLRKAAAIKVVVAKNDVPFNLQVVKRDADHYALSIGLFFPHNFVSPSATREAVAKLRRLVKSCEHSFAFVVGDIADEDAFIEWQMCGIEEAALVESSNHAAGNDSGAPRPRQLQFLSLGVHGVPVHPLGVQPGRATGEGSMSPAWYDAAASNAVVPAVVKLSHLLNNARRMAVETHFSRQKELELSSLTDVVQDLLAGAHQPQSSSSSGMGDLSPSAYPCLPLTPLTAGQVSEALQAYGSLYGLSAALIAAETEAKEAHEARERGEGHGLGQELCWPSFSSSIHAAVHAGTQELLANLPWDEAAARGLARRMMHT